MRTGQPRILLINPFIYDFAAFDCWAKPKGLLEVGFILRQLGYHVDLIDCLDRQDREMAAFAASRPRIKPARSKKFGTGQYFQQQCAKPALMKIMPRRYHRFGFHPELFAEKLRKLPIPPVLIGVTGIMTYWWQGVAETIALVKNIFPSVPVVLGGIYPSLLPEHAVAFSGADLIFTGQATQERIASLLAQAGLEPQPGRPTTTGSDQQPLFYPYPLTTYGVINLSEGCYKHCTYCASRLLRPKVIAYDPAQVYRQIEYLSDRGVEDFSFYDDFLLYKKESRLLPLLRTTALRLPHIRFHAPNGMHLEHVDAECAAVLQQANFKTLRFGFETADQDLLRRTGMKIKDSDFAEKIAILKAAGFKAEQIGIYLMIGIPGQSVESAEQSLKFVRDCGVAAHLTEFSPIPGTPEFEQARRNSLVDFVSNPELQNNSLLSLRDPVFTEEIINRLKNLTRTTNSKRPDYPMKNMKKMKKGVQRIFSDPSCSSCPSGEKNALSVTGTTIRTAWSGQSIISTSGR